MLIEASRWTEYFAELSRQAEGYDTAIEIMSAGMGDQVEVRRAPLRELTYEAREGIAVSVGGRDVEVLRHAIQRPTRVEVTDEPGIPSALMVQEEDGTKTLLRFAAPGPRA